MKKRYVIKVGDIWLRPMPKSREDGGELVYEQKLAPRFDSREEAEEAMVGHLTTPRPRVVALVPRRKKVQECAFCDGPYGCQCHTR